MDRRSACRLLGACTGAVLLSPTQAFSLPSLKRYREVRFVMGTYLDITVYHHSSRNVRAFLDHAFETVQRLERLLSNFCPKSEIAELNSLSLSQKRLFSRETIEVIMHGEEFANSTSGLYDISVGSLTALWRQAQKEHRRPSEMEISKARDAVGFKYVDIEDYEVSRSNSLVTVDTGGIGKGFAVNGIAHLLKQYGIQSALINFGLSTVYAAGSPPEEDGWHLALLFPDSDPIGEVLLRDAALSASSSLSGYLSPLCGQLVDPETGRLIEEQRRTAVLAESPLHAEAASTALTLSVDQGAIASDLGGSIEYYFSSKDAAYKTSGFPIISSKKV